MATLIDASDFLRTVMPAIAAGDAAGLARAVEIRWRPRELCGLLHHADADVRRVAAVALGMVGDLKVISCLTAALRDPDEQVNQMVEHALWAIWFRSGDSRAAGCFREGIRLLEAEAYGPAATCFEQATQIDPHFAEGFNQCAIAHFFLYQWQQSLDCCRRTLGLIPTHFGAIAGMGHCYTQLGDLHRALACYRRAVAINPRLTTISRMIQRLEERQRQINNSSGMFSAEIVG